MPCLLLQRHRRMKEVLSTTATAPALLSFKSELVQGGTAALTSLTLSLT